MENNYYDILEINKNASQEIIEKAYKTLIKKYHPDLQEDSLKAQSEEKVKLINEAYDVLSDPEKRKNYDMTLENNEISSDDYNNLVNENKNLENELNYLKNNLNNLKNNTQSNYASTNSYQNSYNRTNNINTNYNTQNQNPNINYNNYQSSINNARNEAYQRAYRDAYVQDLRNRGYKIRYKKSWKEIGKNILALLITIGILIIIGIILWHIPTTKQYLINMYNENSILQFLVNIFINLFTSF